MSQRISKKTSSLEAIYEFVIVFLFVGLFLGCTSRNDKINIEVAEDNVVLVEGRIVPIEDLKHAIDSILIDYNTEQYEKIIFTIKASAESSVKVIVEIRDVLKEIKAEKELEKVRVKHIKN